MMIATMHDAMPVFGYALGAGVIAALLLAGAWLTFRAREKLPRGGRIAIAAVLAVVSVPAWAVTGLLVLFALAIGDCPPDAYECPF
jgi:hypothetical protein